MLKLGLLNWKMCRGRLPDGPTGGGEIRVVWGTCWMIWIGHLGARRDYKIHPCAMSIERLMSDAYAVIATNKGIQQFIVS